MAVKYTNSKGETYYLKGSTTKTGKVRYNFVKSAATVGLVDEIPAGYEVTESVNGKVNVRVIIPQEITDDECALIQTILESESVKKACKYDVKGDTITIYEAHVPDFSTGVFIGGDSQRKDLEEMMLKTAPYEPIVKFELVDRETRIFTSFRMCFLGGIGEWMVLNDGTLDSLCCELLPHIGQESFYELM